MGSQPAVLSSLVLSAGSKWRCALAYCPDFLGRGAHPTHPEYLGRGMSCAFACKHHIVQKVARGRGSGQKERAEIKGTREVNKNFDDERQKKGNFPLNGRAASRIVAHQLHARGGKAAHLNHCIYPAAG